MLDDLVPNRVIPLTKQTITVRLPPDILLKSHGFCTSARFFEMYVLRFHSCSTSLETQISFEIEENWREN